MGHFDALLIDAGTGNLHSVFNALHSLGYKIRVTADPGELAAGGRVILPGVGAFGSFMQGLRERGLVEPLQAVFRRGDPLFGICVGMQALFDTSFEMGEHDGLGLLPGQVLRFETQPGLKIPHTGWNQLVFSEDCLLFSGLRSGAYAYFNHSYYCASSRSEDTASRTDYNIEFTSAVQRQNLFGVQFHLEKSQRVGRAVLANFFKT